MSGGMGTVYKAFDSVLHRHAAIKIMHPHLLENPKNQERFVQEARAAARLNHPNIVTIYEIGETENDRFIVMEYIDGPTLSIFLNDRNQPPVELAINLMIQVLNALEFAHQRNILHRDIKPDNILLANETAKILDFGIAKILSNRAFTAANDVLGSVEFMAPEQMTGEGVDRRSDIYSAGVMFYQLLTRVLPFSGETPVAVLYKQLNESPLKPSQHNPDISPELDRIILKALAPKDERWSTAQEFSDVLQTLLAPQQPKDASVSASTGSAEGEKISLAQEEFEEKEAFGQAFVGRKEEFQKLKHVARQAFLGAGQTAIINGEAGVGKTTLVDQLSKFASEQNAFVLYSACLYQEGMDAFMPFIDTLKDFFSNQSHQLDPDQRQQLKKLVAEKVPLLLEFAERFSTTFENKVEMEARAVSLDEAVANANNPLEGVFLLISLISTMRPLVLIVDDMHWSDESSLRLFHYLSRNIGDSRILLIGVCRSNRYDLIQDGKPTKVVELLSRMRRENLFSDINLQRFSLTECKELIDGMLGQCNFTEHFYEQIHNETKGNPFFLIETLRLLKDNDIIFLNDEQWEHQRGDIKLDIPHRVEDVFIRQLNDLDKYEREILQVASVIGHAFDASILASVLEEKKLTVLKLLQRLEQDLQIVISTETGFRFEHPMLRELLYTEIPFALRREYHLMIAEEYGQIYQSEFGSYIGEVAQHFRQGEDYQRAIPLLYKSAKRVFKLAAFEEALQIFLDLKETIRKSGQDEWLEIPMSNIHLKVGICHEELEQFEQALAAYQLLMETSRGKGEHDREVEAYRRTGRVQEKLGNCDAALEDYQNGLKIAEKYGLKGKRSDLLNHIGLTHLRMGQFDLALTIFEEAIKVSDCDKKQSDIAQACTNKGIVENIQMRHEEALQSFEAALKLNGDREDGAFLARVNHHIGETYLAQKKFSEAHAAFDASHQHLQSEKVPGLKALNLVRVSELHAEKEEYSHALKLIEEAQKLVKKEKDDAGLAEVYHQFGNIYAELDEHKKAEHYLEQSIRLNEGKDNAEGVARSCVSYGYFLEKTGRIQDATTYFRRAWEILNDLKLFKRARVTREKLDFLLAVTV